MKPINFKLKNSEIPKTASRKSKSGPVQGHDPTSPARSTSTWNGSKSGQQNVYRCFLMQTVVSQFTFVPSPVSMPVFHLNTPFAQIKVMALCEKLLFVDIQCIKVQCSHQGHPRIPNVTLLGGQASLLTCSSLWPALKFIHLQQVYFLVGNCGFVVCCYQNFIRIAFSLRTL